MPIITLTLSQRAGRFELCESICQGWSRLHTAFQAVLQLVRLDTPLFVDQAIIDCRRAARGDHGRTTLVVRCEIADRFRPNFEGTLLALTRHATAETIILLNANDPRYALLTAINRAVARDGYRLELRLGDYAVTLENMARAPYARRDRPWAGTIVLRATDWNTEQFLITGRGHDIPRVIIDLQNHRKRFNGLIREAAPFVSVTGRGFVNRARLKVVDVETIERREHNDLPREMQLHFARAVQVPHGDRPVLA